MEHERIRLILALTREAPDLQTRVLRTRLAHCLETGAVVSLTRHEHVLVDRVLREHGLPAQAGYIRIAAPSATAQAARLAVEYTDVIDGSVIHDSVARTLAALLADAGGAECFGELASGEPVSVDAFSLALAEAWRGSQTIAHTQMVACMRRWLQLKVGKVPRTRRSPSP